MKADSATVIVFAGDDQEVRIGEIALLNPVHTPPLLEQLRQIPTLIKNALSTSSPSTKPPQRPLPPKNAIAVQVTPDGQVCHPQISPDALLTDSSIIDFLVHQINANPTVKEALALGTRETIADHPDLHMLAVNNLM